MKQRYAFRILSMLLAFVLVFELFPTGALAQDAGTGETDATTAREWPKAKPAVQSLAK